VRFTGAAGSNSFVIILVGVYYSARILLLGAEITHIYASKYGLMPVRRVVPVELRFPTLRRSIRRFASAGTSTDPEARLYKKAQGQEAKRGYLGPVLMENRHGWVVNTRLTLATGTAEREAAVEMVRLLRRDRSGSKPVRKDFGERQRREETGYASPVAGIFSAVSCLHGSDRYLR
jgi:hypothetical protein